MALVRTGIELELAGFQKFVQGLGQVERAQQTLKQNTERATNALSVFELALSAFGSNLGKSAVANLDLITKSISKFYKAFVGFKNIDVGETELKAKLDSLAKAIVNSAGSFDALNKAASNVSSEQVRLLGESVRKFVFAFDSLIKLENFNSNTLTSKLNEIKVALDSAQNEFRELGNVAKTIASSDLEKLGTSLKAFTDSIKAIVSIKGLGDLGNNLKIMSDNILKFSQSLALFNNALSFSKKIETFGLSLKTLVVGLRSVINIKNLYTLPANISLIVTNMRSLESSLSSFGQNTNISQFSSQIKIVGEAFKLFAAGFRSLLNIKNFNELPIRLKEISDSINNLYKNLGKLNSISGFYTDFDTLAKAFQRLAAGTRSLVNIRDINKLPQNIQHIVDALRSLQAVDIEAIGKHLANLAGPLKDLASAARALKSLEDAKKAGNNLRDLAEGLEGVNPLMKAFIFTAKGFATLSFNAIRNALPQFLQLSKVIASFALNKLINAFQFLFNVLVRNPIAFVIRLFQSFVNVLGNVVKALGNLFSFATRLGGIFNSSSNSTKRQSDTLQDFSNNSVEAAQSINALINNQNKANNSSSNLNTNFQTLNNTVEKFQPKSFSIFGRELDSLNPKVINLAAALTSLNVIGNVLSRTFESLSNNFRNIGSDAITAIKNAENLQLQISVLQARELVQTGQFDDIDAAMEQAQQNAAKLISDFKILAQITPFETNDLVAAFKQLQTFGFLTDDAINLTKIISTIPGITGDSLREIAVVFGQIRTSGKLSQQDLRQLTDRGIDVAGAFQKAYKEIEGGSISAGEALEWAKEGGLSTNDAIAAIAKSIGQDFAGSLALSAQTTEALFSSIKSLKDEALVNLFGPVLEQSKRFLNDLIAIGNQPEVMQYLRDLGTTIGGYLATAIDNVISVIGGLIAVWRDIPPETKALIGQFAQFAAITIGVTFALSALQAVLGVAAFAFTVLVNPVSIIVGAMVGMGFVFKNNEEIITNWANNATNTINNFANNITAFVNLLFTDFEAALTAVVDFGSGLISAFVDGIISAFNLVATAMQQLGNLIAFWLQPGSPPRVLPDIDDWGTAAANEFLQGFTVADFNYIKDFGSTVENLLESINIEGVDTSALSNLFAKALDEINVTGNIDLGSVFESIEQIVPQASTEVKGLAEQYLNVIQQTRALENATNEYSDAVKGLNDLEESETLSNEEKRIKSLQDFAKSQFITDEQRANSLNQIAKIQQGQLIRQAEKQLKQAEDELDATKARIDLANQFKDETVETTGALENSSDAGESLKDELEKAGKAGKGALDDITNIGDRLGGLSDIQLPNFDGASSSLGGLSDIIAGLENPLDSLSEQFETAKTNIENAIKPIIDLYNTLRANTELVIVSLGSLALFLGGAKLVGGFTALKLAIAPLVSTVGLPALALGLLAVGAGIIFANTEFGKEKISSTLTNITAAFESFERAFTINDVYSIVDEFVKIDLSSVENMGNTLGINASIVKNRIDEFASNIYTGLTEAYTLIINGTNPLDALSIVFSGTDFRTTLTNAKNTFVENIRTFADGVPAAFEQLKIDLSADFNAFVSTVSIDIPKAFQRGFKIGKIDSIADGVTLGISFALADVQSKLPENHFAATMIDSLMKAFAVNDRSNIAVDLVIAITNGLSNAISNIDTAAIQQSLNDTIGSIFGEINIEPLNVAFRAVRESFKILNENLSKIDSSGNTQLKILIESSKELIANVIRVAGGIGAILSVLALSILPELPEIFNDIVTFGSGILDFVTDTVEAIVKFVTGEATFAETATAIISSFGENIQKVFGAIDSFSKNIIDIFGNIIRITGEALGIDLSDLQAGFDRLRPVLEFLVSTIITGGLGKVLGLFTKLGSGNLAKLIAQLAKNLTKFAQAMLLTFGGSLIANFGNLSTGLNNFFIQLGTNFIDLAIFVGNGILNVISFYIKWWTNAITGVVKLLIQIGKNFVGLVDFIGDLISGFFESVLTGIGQWLHDTTTAIATGIKNWKDYIVAFLQSLFEVWGEWFQNIINFYVTFWGNVINILIGVGTSILNWVRELATNVFNGMVDIARNIINKIEEFITNAINTVLTIYDRIKENIRTATDGIIAIITGIFNTFSQTVTDIINIEWTNPFTDFEGFIDDVITAIGKIILSAGKIAIGILEKAKTWADPFPVLKGFIQNVIDLIISIVTNVMEMIAKIKKIEWVNPFTDFEGFIQNIIDLATAIYDAFVGIKDDIVNNIEWVNPFGDLVTFIDNIKLNILGVLSTFLNTKAGITLLKWFDPFVKLSEFVGNVITRIGEIVTNISDTALSIAGYLFNDPFTILTGYITVVTEYITGIVNVFNDVRDSLKTINWSDPFSILTGFIFSVRLAIAGVFAIMKQTALDLLTVVFNDPFTKLSEFIQNIKDAAGTIWQYLKDLALDLITVDWKNPFSGLFGHIDTAITKINELIALINRVPGVQLPTIGVNNQNATPTGDANDFSSTLAGLNAGSAMVERGELSLGEFDSVVEKLRKAGLATGEGFIIGFQAAADKWPLDFRNSGDVAVQAVKDALEIESPSKVMINEVGKPMADGVILGFKNNFKLSEFTELFTENLALFTNYYLNATNLTLAYYNSFLLAQSAFFTNLTTLLTLFFSTTFTSLGTFFSNIFTSLETFLNNSIFEINNKIAIIISNVNRDLAIILGLFTTFMSDVLTALTTFMANVSTKMYEIVGIFNGSITAAIAEFVKVINETMYTNISNAINSVLGSLFYEYVTKSDNAWQKIGDDMAYAFITGMVNGITKRIRDVIRTVQKLVQDSLDAGKKALEASSPSKLTQREIGEPFSQGIALGIINDSENVKNSINSLLDFSNIEIKNSDYALKKLENILIVGVDNILKKLNDNLDLFVNSYESVQNNLVPNEIFDTNQNSIVQQSDRLTSSLLSGLDSFLLSNQRSSDISTRNITQESSNSFVRNSTRNYNLYLSVDENQYTNVNKNFKVMEYLGI